MLISRAIQQNKCDLAKDPSIPSGEELQRFVTENKFALRVHLKLRASTP